MANFKGLLLLSFLFCGRTFAYVAEEGKVSASIGPFYAMTDFDGSPTGAESQWAGGFGLVVNGDAYSGGGLEIGLFQMRKTYFRESGGKYVGQRTPLLHITMGYRWYLTERYSLSAALSSGYRMGDPEYVHDDFKTNSRPDTSAMDVVEYGVDLAAQSELWAHGKHSIVLDVRYGLSLTSKSSEEGNHFGAMLGYRQVIQEKREQEPKKP